MLHVSFSHAWSSSKPKEKSVDMDIYYSSHIFPGCSKLSVQFLFLNTSKLCLFFPEICQILSKSAKSSLFVTLGECHFSASWWHLLEKSQPACDEPWMDKHNATRGTIEKGTMANLPHANCKCTEHWLQLTIRHFNELAISLKGSKSRSREKIIHRICTESLSYKARHGNESLRKNVQSLS